MEPCQCRFAPPFHSFFVVVSGGKRVRHTSTEAKLPLAESCLSNSHCGGLPFQGNLWEKSAVPPLSTFERQMHPQTPHTKMKTLDLSDTPHDKFKQSYQLAMPTMLMTTACSPSTGLPKLESKCLRPAAQKWRKRKNLATMHRKNLSDCGEYACKIKSPHESKQAVLVLQGKGHSSLHTGGEAKQCPDIMFWSTQYGLMWRSRDN